MDLDLPKSFFYTAMTTSWKKYIVAERDVKKTLTLTEFIDHLSFSDRETF